MKGVSAAVARSRALRVIAILFALSLLVVPTGAMAANMSWVLRFDAPEQSLWPGASTGSISGTSGTNITDGVLAGSGINVTVNGSSGTVTGNVEGRLNVSYTDRLARPGRNTISFSYNAIPGESNISTALGGSLNIGMTLRANFPWYTLLPSVNVTETLWNANMQLNTSNNFNYEKGVQKVGSGTYSPNISVGFDAVLAGVNVNALVTQNTYFTPDRVIGTLMASNLSTGTTQQCFMWATDRTLYEIPLDLSEPGWWALTLRDMQLDTNSFYTNLALNVTGSFWASIIGSTSLSFGATVYQTNPMELAFNEVDNLGTFLVFVGSEPVPTPVPAAVWLLAPAFAGIFGFRKKFKKM